MATSASEAGEAQDRAREHVSAMNLPPDLLAKYRKKFDALDLNKDGIVTLREFASVSKVFGYNLTREEILVRSAYSVFMYPSCLIYEYELLIIGPKGGSDEG